MEKMKRKSASTFFKRVGYGKEVEASFTLVMMSIVALLSFGVVSFVLALLSRCCFRPQVR